MGVDEAEVDIYHRGLVEEMVDSGRPLEQIEREIERMPLEREKQDALAVWAWAWAESRPTRRAVRSLAKLHALVMFSG